MIGGSVEQEMPEYPGRPENAGPVFTEEELRLLDHINRRIASGTTLRDVITFLFEQVQSVIPCDRIGVAFIEENEQRLVLHIVVARYPELHLGEGYSADIEGSSLKEIFASDSPRIINDLAAYGESHPASESTRLLLREGILSSMTCPLKVDGRFVGLLFFSSTHATAYRARQVSFHLAIAERLGQSVEKAYMIDQLTGSINSYMEMLGFVTHELRSPLHTIITVGNTLTAGYFGPLQEKQAEMVGRMVERAEQLNRTVDDYLNLSRFENNTMTISPRSCDFIREVVHHAVEAVDPQIRKAGMDLSLQIPEDLPPVTCDPDLFRIVLGNLLSNAVKYGREKGMIRVAAGISGSSLEVSVWNSGPGFPMHEKKKLFRKFSRIMTPELSRIKGSGIGLYTSWKIIKLHGGSMKAESREGEWARFSFIFPL
jgi:signal transduction histidine kinase